MNLTERIEAAAKESLRNDPDDWAAAGEAAEQASNGRYREHLAMVDWYAGDGRTISAGLLNGQPVRLIFRDDGNVWLIVITLPKADPKGQWAVQYITPYGDADSKYYTDLAKAELVAAVRHAQGCAQVTVVDLATVIPDSAWDRNTLSNQNT